MLGDLVQEGIVAKLADDLYCGGNTPDELLKSFERVLRALQQNSLNLSASKTTIAPRQTTILGWVWRSGSLQALPHRVATLSTCSAPPTVSALRSFIGAYKVLSRVIKDSASFIAPLDDVVAGRDSRDKIQWTDGLHEAFSAAQDALLSNRSIVLPQPSDTLWIVTDGASKNHGLGATLYVSRDNTTHLAGFFSAKLRCRQVTWIPCEIEALSIAAAIKHFSPYIIQSANKTCVLTDSKPCVQAFEKLCRGEFSASPRVSTFLSTASRYQTSIRHVAGSSILPSDFASRNARECDDPTCQICSFVRFAEESTVRQANIQDITDGKSRLPFTSRGAWNVIQAECPDLRRANAHLRQGTRPSKKLTGIRDVKRYIQVASIAKDGLMVVKRTDPLHPTRECIIVPRSVLDGLLTSLHLKLDHPTAHQLKTVVHRSFYALDMDKAIEHVSLSCHQCSALRSTPATIVQQDSSDPPETVGSSFAADIIKRERQLIFVVRECVTSFTATMLVTDERAQTLRDGILQLCAELHPLDGPFAVIRTDPAPGFVALCNDELLNRHRISIEVGRVKNKNKNPVAEKAIRELESEILRQDPGCSVVTPVLLSLSTARMNSRIRNRGLSAREMWTQRDQFSNVQIPLKDSELIERQHELRTANHPMSERSKCPNNRHPSQCQVNVGDLVYITSDGNKSRARDRYLVTSVDGDWCNIRKFAGSQLRRSSYRVKQSECFNVPPAVPKDCSHHKYSASPEYSSDHLSEDDEATPPPCPVLPPPAPPPIPTDIAETSYEPHPTATYEPPPCTPIETPSPIASTIPTPEPEPPSASPSTSTKDRPKRLKQTPAYLSDYELDF